MQLNLRSLFLGLGCLAAVGASADVPLNYYQSLDGLTGGDLKDALHQLVTADVTMLGYGSGNNKTWWGFYLTDRNVDDNTVIDRYSNEVFYFGSQGSSVSGMNIEHSFPKSWWGGNSNNAYKDLLNLMPCEARINSSKSNYPMGVVLNAKTDNGVTRVGTGSDGKQLWEPGDAWKGDFARTYMYMATAYQDLTWSGTQALQILEQNDYPTLQKWASDLYITWAKADPVAPIELARNNQVMEIQGCRNPYVDFPNLMHYVWGDSVGVAFNIATTVKSPTIIVEREEVELYASTFMNGDTGGCTIENTLKPSAVSAVWKNNSSYGWVAKASTGSGTSLTNHAADSRLVTPAIDLSRCSSATMKFDHACKFADSPAEVLQVLVRDTATGEEHALSGFNWPSGANWNFVPSRAIDLSDYCGKTVNIVFRYTSTTSEACTWEVQNLVVTGFQTSGSDPVPPVGDINGDGVADSADVAILVDAVMGNAIHPGADINGDGKVNATDIGLVILSMLGL